MNRILSALVVPLLLSGCVNVHVHFPAAQDAPAATAAPAKPAPAENGNDKK